MIAWLLCPYPSTVWSRRVTFVPTARAVAALPQDSTVLGTGRVHSGGGWQAGGAWEVVKETQFGLWSLDFAAQIAQSMAVWQSGGRKLRGRTPTLPADPLASFSSKETWPTPGVTD